MQSRSISPLIYLSFPIQALTDKRMAHSTTIDKNAELRPAREDTTDYYIFVANDVDKYRLSFPSALQIADECLNKRVWGFGFRARYKSDIKKGDQVLIYLGGGREYRHSFMATAKITGT